MTRKEALEKIDKIIRDVYGDSVFVQITVNSEGILCTSDERPYTIGCSMQTLNGNWLDREGE